MADEEPAVEEQAPQQEEERPEAEPEKRGLVWNDLSESQLTQFWECEDPAERIRILCGFLGVKRYKTNPRAAIYVDFCFYNLIFAMEEAKFDNYEKTSAFFSIMLQAYEEATDPANGFPTMEKNYEFFKTKILQHSVEDAEKGCVSVFNVHDIKAITQFITKSFYRHYKSYQYSAKEVQETEVVVKELVVETPLPPVPLSAEGWVMEGEENVGVEGPEGGDDGEEES